HSRKPSSINLFGHPEYEATSSTLKRLLHHGYKDLRAFHKNVQKLVEKCGNTRKLLDEKHRLYKAHQNDLKSSLKKDAETTKTIR
ncbi:hypothetical protein CHS0354_014076, partial [Potamilus streckersoni]